MIFSVPGWYLGEVDKVRGSLGLGKNFEWVGTMPKSPLRFPSDGHLKVEWIGDDGEMMTNLGAVGPQ